MFHIYMGEDHVIATVPTSVFIGYGYKGLTLVKAVKSDSGIRFEEHEVHYKDLHDFVYRDLSSHLVNTGEKVVGAGIADVPDSKPLGERLWLELDIVPYLTNPHGNTARRRAKYLAEYINTDNVTVEGLDVNQINVNYHHYIEPSFLTTLNAYEKVSRKEDFKLLHDEAARFKKLSKGEPLLFVNSTAQGGGVALMRHALIRLYQLLDIPVDWFVIDGDPEVFVITKKKFHNILQGVNPGAEALTSEEKKKYIRWISENAHKLDGVFHHASAIVVDDAQPSGLIPFIKNANSRTPILFRSHIQIDTSLFGDADSPQRITWDFIWNHNHVSKADLFISHPIDHFVPDTVPKVQNVLMPATTDPLDGLNKPLSKQQMDYYLTLFDGFIARDGQKPLDRTRPFISQIARFDPSKGIPDLLEAYLAFRDLCKRDERPLEEIPQLIIAGHGSVDDPEGLPILQQVKFTLQSDRFVDIAEDVKVARLPHNDQILNALLAGAKFATQLSHKEGFEVKITEALYKGKPLIIYRSGGMPLQVVEDMNAFVVETGRTYQVAEHMYSLSFDRKLYDKMSKNATEMVNPEYFTVKQAAKWLWLVNELIENGKIEGNGRNVSELIAEKHKT